MPWEMAAIANLGVSRYENEAFCSLKNSFELDSAPGHCLVSRMVPRSHLQERKEVTELCEECSMVLNHLDTGI